MRTLALNTIPCTLLWLCLSPLSFGMAGRAQDTQSTPSTSPPVTESSPAPTQDCAKTKDTCEVPPEPTPTQATPSQATPPQPAPPQAEQPAQAPAANKPSAKGKPSPTSASKKKKARKKKSTTSASGPRKVVVRDGGTSEPEAQLSPAVPREQQSRQSTNQLLASAQNNLKTVSTRTLTANQQATIEQIKMFIEQANSAVKEGDMQRGHNLAMKAHLLSDDLVRH